MPFRLHLASWGQGPNTYLFLSSQQYTFTIPLVSIPTPTPFDHWSLLVSHHLSSPLSFPISHSPPSPLLSLYLLPTSFSIPLSPFLPTYHLPLSSLSFCLPISPSSCLSLFFPCLFLSFLLVASPYVSTSCFSLFPSIYLPCLSTSFRFKNRGFQICVI